MSTIRLTMAQALVRAMAAQTCEIDGEVLPIFAGVWGIFGHGNVAGLGEALHGVRARLPTFRGHNEQGMVHAATAYAKAMRRRRFMACTSSIGPGALNMVTGAAVAHVNRLPVLLLPGDVFADRLPDPVLQQIENFGDGTISASDCFRPVSRYFDRITRPEQLIPAFARAMAVLTDPAECGPVTLSLCQDVQAEAYDYPEAFFAERLHRLRRPRPDAHELAAAASALRRARRPMVIAGGGVLYADAHEALGRFCAERGVPVGETQSGKSAIAHSHPLSLGGIGVSGSTAANVVAERADMILAIGTRLQDFTTGSWALFRETGLQIVALNTQVFDAGKHQALPLVADALAGLEALDAALGDWRADRDWTTEAGRARSEWRETAARYQVPPAPEQNTNPSDAQVIGAVLRRARPSDIVVCAAGGLPAELQKHWRTEQPGGYHMEYGFSCMGYELAGGLGVKMACPDREVFVMLGDGSYMMLNSELQTAVMLGHKLTVVLLDNNGFACINRLQAACGGAAFNNLWRDSMHQAEYPAIDFAAHARAMGAQAEKVADLGALEAALDRARTSAHSHVIVIDTDPMATTEAGGAWWDVAVPQVSERPAVHAAHERYTAARRHQRVSN